MKTFAGIWRLSPGKRWTLWRIWSESFTFYFVEPNKVVIRSDNGKYFQLEQPLKKGSEGRPAFTAFTATAEFGAAFKFDWRDEQFDTSPPAEFAGMYRLCVKFDATKNPNRIWIRDCYVAPQCIQLGFGALNGDGSLRRDGQDLADLDGNHVWKAVPTLEEIRMLPDGGWTWTGSSWSRDLSNVDLSGQNLSKLSLEDTDLSGANLTGANVDGLVLTDAYLEGADFSYLDLTNTNYDTLQGVRYRDGKMVFRKYRKDGSPPSVVGREGKLTSFRCATVPASLLGKDWSYVDLSGATITGLSGTDLRGLKAVGANLSRVDLSGSTLDNADFTKSTIIKAYFIKCSLKKSVFREALLYGTEFTSSNIEDGDFRSAQLGRVDDEKPQASFSYTYLFNADFRSSNLYRVNFFGVSMFGAETKMGDEAILDNVVMTNSYLAEINFQNLKMRGADLSNCCLVNANFTGSDLSELSGPTKLLSACLHGANFSDAHLEGADLTDAVISFDHGELPVQYYDEKRELHYQINKHYQKTSGLDKTDGLPPTMICPNGKRIEDNRRVGWKEMMTCKDAPKKWLPPPRT